MTTRSMKHTMTMCGVGAWATAVVDAAQHGGDLTAFGMFALCVSLAAYVQRRQIGKVQR